MNKKLSELSLSELASERAQITEQFEKVKKIAAEKYKEIIQTFTTAYIKQIEEIEKEALLKAQTHRKIQ